MQVVKYNGKVIISKLDIANTPMEKMIGLLMRKKIGEEEGLLLVGCRCIHTFFMKFEIDAFFLNKSKKILKIYKNVSPWRITGYIRDAVYVLETAGGIADRYNLKEGDNLEF